MYADHGMCTRVFARSPTLLLHEGTSTRGSPPSRALGQGHATGYPQRVPVPITSIQPIPLAIQQVAGTRRGKPVR